VTAIPIHATIADVAALSVKTGLSRFPVMDPDIDHVSGVVHVKDLFRVPPVQRSRITVEQLIRPVIGIPEVTTLDQLLRRLRASRRQMALVVDEFGGTAGVVTLEDLLEQIVGRIRDEFDQIVEEIDEEPGGIHGGANQYEVRETCGFDLPHGRWETIAGFIMARLGRLPQVGDRVEHEGWILQVTAMTGNRVETVRLTQAGTRL
jgi:CBS domain containing-hemolysin-like protein